MRRNPTSNDPSVDERDELLCRIQELVQCMGLIKTVDCNSAFLHLMEAQTWDEIDGGFRMTNSPEDFIRMAQEIILMVADGNISSEQRFREQAMRDNLTGLYNRRYLYQSLTDLIERAKTNGSVVSVIFMDLDRFKAVVDTYGHLNGSRTIKEVAASIRETLEKPAYAVAYAGDEFVVVLPGFDPAQAIGQTKKIQARIKKAVFLREQGLEVRIQSSFGIATFPYHADDMTNLLAAADHALFGAKGFGKDSIKSFGLSGSLTRPK